MTFPLMTEDLGHFDLLIVGTNLPNCQSALYYSKLLAVLIIYHREHAKGGKKILHIDKSPHYGGYTEATVKLDQSLVDRLGGRISDERGLFRTLDVDLNPYLITREGGFASELLKQDLSSYLEFIPIKHHGIIFDSRPVTIPRSKEEVMLNEALSLPDKRQIMKFLSTLSHADKDIRSAISNANLLLSDLFYYGICGFSDRGSAQNAKDFELIERARQFLKCPDLLLTYGGCSSINQAYCRRAALLGVTHILSQPELAISNGKVDGIFEDRPWTATYTKVIITDKPQHEDTAVDRWRAILLTNTALFNIEGDNYWIIPPCHEQQTLFLLQLCHNLQPRYIIYVWMDTNDGDQFINHVSKFVPNQLASFNYPSNKCPNNSTNGNKNPC